MKVILVLGFILLVFLCIQFKAGHIEDDLTQRSGQALLQAGIEIKQIYFDGRDAHISGQLPSSEDINKAELLVANVFGVRTVHNDLKLVKPIIEKPEHPEIQPVIFAYNQAKINIEDQAMLQKIAQRMQENSALHLRISGHTDSHGSASYNLNLSKQRARAVKEFMLQNGVETSQLIMEFHGSSIPADQSEPEMNRRVELNLYEE